MDQSRLSRDDKARIHIQGTKNANASPGIRFPLYYPIKWLGDIMVAIFKIVSPYTTNLIPLVVFLLSIPVIAFLSASAGFLVWRSVAVGWEADVTLQYGDGVPPYAEIALPNVVAGQPYEISLQLTVPASESNLALGNFMASLLITTLSKDSTLAFVRKPAIVLPPSLSLRSWPYQGRSTVELDIPMLSSFALDTARAVARVELGRRDQWKSIGSGEGRELTVLAAVLRGVVVHKGVRGLVSRFPVTTAVVAACTFLFLSFVVLAACLLPALELRFDSDPHFNDPPPPRPRRNRRHTSTGISTDAGKSPRSPRRTDSRNAGDLLVPKNEDIELDPLDLKVEHQDLPLDQHLQYYITRTPAYVAEQPEDGPVTTPPISSPLDRDMFPRRRWSRRGSRESDEDE